MRLPQPDRSGPRPVILALFVVLAIVLITVWFREGDDGPLHRIRIGVHTAVTPISAAGETITRPVRGLLDWAGDLGVSRSQLEQLRDQNAALRARVAELEEARLENERLRGLLDITQAGDLEALGANVIGRPINSWEGVITIDRGSRDGVAPGMPVVGADGLLGQTIDVGPVSSRVRLISDQRSSVSAFVQRSRAEGIVQGSIDGRITLQFVSIETTLQAGDVVITSGMGGVYPKGLVVGEIVDVRTDPGRLYQDVRIRPAAELEGIEEVLVLTGAPATELPSGGGE
jgi:rod shape-determining protein MreC